MTESKINLTHIGDIAANGDTLHMDTEHHPTHQAPLLSGEAHSTTTHLEPLNTSLSLQDTNTMHGMTMFECGVPETNGWLAVMRKSIFNVIIPVIEQRVNT